jgi:hypothetical protein
MEIIGPNIETKNKSNLVKDIIINMPGVEIELKTTKRGIAIHIFKGQIVKNGTTFLVLRENEKPYNFEKIITRTD